MKRLVIRIDRARARALAAALEGVAPRAAHFLPRPRTPAGARRLLEVYLAWVGICQQTRTLAGAVDGVRLRGSDYLAHRMAAVADEDPERFASARLAALPSRELAGWLADDGDPAHTTADRLDERAALLNDLGRRLLSGYGGDAARLLSASKGRLGGRFGLFARLARFRAYRDPARKKSYLLVLFLRGLGIFEPVDPGAIGLPADYHILRVFLRAGVLALSGERAPALLTGGPMTAEEDARLRRAAVAAARAMVETVPLEVLDLLLWMVGRNCCFYEHEPVCRTGPCTLEATCSLLASTDLACARRCPLEGACLGSRDAAFAALREPAFDTDLY